MFGGDFGVGVMALDTRPFPAGALSPGVAEPADLLPPGVVERPARLGELMPVAWRSDTELAGELQRITRAEAQLAAWKAEVVMGLAARRPADEDRAPDEPGAASPGWMSSWDWETVTLGVGEFFCDELATIMNSSRAAATTLFEQSATLLGRLRSTWAALADGRLDWPRARKIAAELGWAARETDPAVIREVEAAILPIADELPIRALEAAIRRELVSRDPAAMDRRRRDLTRRSDVTVRRVGDGMSLFSALVPTERAEAWRDTVHRIAWELKQAGDPRPIGPIRVAVLEDLILRPWDDRREPVTAHLTIVAPLWSLFPDAGLPPGSFENSYLTVVEPGRRVGWPATGTTVVAPAPAPPEVDGEPITTAHLRALLERLDAVCPGGLQAPPGGTLSIAIVDDAGRLRAVTDRRELGRLVRRGCPDHPGTDCDCAVLDRPPSVDRYEHTPAQRRFVTTRDRTCRQPGCTNRAGWADLDHVLAHADGGETDCGNLCCLCRRHHRLKTHAHGWSFTMSEDGVLTVTTPSGVTRVTRPPGLAPPADPAADPPPF
jgi:hypothetical protein